MRFEVLKGFSVHNTVHKKDEKGNVETTTTATEMEVGKMYDSKACGMKDKTVFALGLGKEPFIHIENVRPPVSDKKEK
jgi:hypothetical protein